MKGRLQAWAEPGFAQYTNGELYEAARCGAHSKTNLLFPFDLDTYSRDMGNGGAPDGPIIGEMYREDLSRMLFEWEELKEALKPQEPATSPRPDNPSPIINTSPQMNKDGSSRVIVPLDLFTGKDPATACENLKAKGLDKAIIAHVLVRKMKTTKLKAGQLIFDNITLENATFIRKVNKLLKHMTFSLEFQ